MSRFAMSITTFTRAPQYIAIFASPTQEPNASKSARLCPITSTLDAAFIRAISSFDTTRACTFDRFCTERVTPP